MPLCSSKNSELAGVGCEDDKLLHRLKEIQASEGWSWASFFNLRMSGRKGVRGPAGQDSQGLPWLTLQCWENLILRVGAGVLGPGSRGAETWNDTWPCVHLSSCLP